MDETLYTNILADLQDAIQNICETYQANEITADPLTVMELVETTERLAKIMVKIAED